MKTQPKDRRVRVVIGTGLILAASFALAVVTRGPAPSELHAGADPQAVAEMELRARSTSSCYEQAIIDYYLPATLEMADRAAGGDGWLVEESRYVYVGDLRQAKTDIGETIAVGEDKAWILGSDADGSILYEYHAFATAKGRTVWILVSQERTQPDEACN